MTDSNKMEIDVTSERAHKCYEWAAEKYGDDFHLKYNIVDIALEFVESEKTRTELTRDNIDLNKLYVVSFDDLKIGDILSNVVNLDYKGFKHRSGYVYEIVDYVDEHFVIKDLSMGFEYDIDREKFDNCKDLKRYVG